ncbi:MAG: hypothetical protein OET18_00345 [Desulfobacterales bacterium]|jgi:hypothetical protein|nr:hypothetical protein [Desulfobacterales bacterium]
MARIATYPVDAIPTVNDKVIGTDVDNELITKNYRIGDILALVPGGSASVQSLNTLTGDLNLIGAGGISISASGTDITITGSSSGGGIKSIDGATGPDIDLAGKGGITITTSGNLINIDGSGIGGGIQTIDGATGPDIDLAGKGGITVTRVGNLINIDGSGIGGGNPGAPVNGVQFNDGGSFGAGEFFKVDLKGFGNPAVNIGKGQEFKGQLNIFAGAGEGAFYGETRYYDAVGSGQFAAWATPGQILKQSYAVALPENEPVTGQVLVIDKTPTPSSPFTSIWSTVGSSADEKFKYDSADTQAGFFSDKVLIGSGLSGSVNTDVQGVKTLTISAQSVNTVNSIKVGSSSASGTFGFEGSGVTMRTGGANEPQQIVDFDYQDTLVSGTNIKTINGNSLLGGGNLVISSGGGTPGGSNGQIQFNDNSNFQGDTNLNWDTTNNILVVGKETNPTFTEGVIHLKGNGSTEGGKVKFQTGAGKGSPVDITLQAPDSGVAQTITLPDTLPSKDTQVLGIKSVNGSVVETQWETPIAITGVSSIEGTSDVTGKIIFSGLGVSQNGNTFTFNGGSSGVTDVTATTPLSSTQGATPNISISESDENTNGYLSSTNFTAFKAKQAALVSGSNIKTVNGNSLLGSGNLAITATATPGGAVSNIQFHNANGLLDGDSQFTYNLDSVNKIATVKIGNETSPSETYGVLRLDGNLNSEGGRVEFRTGASKAGPAQTVTVKAPDAGVEQVISLPETLPTATTQVLGLKAINATDIRTEWVAAGGTSLPYTSYEANFSVTANTVSEKVLSNTTGLFFGWIDNTQGQLIVKMGGLQKEVDVLVLLNGYGGKGQVVQCFFGGYNKSQAEITIDIMDQNFVNQNQDITQGNIEIRVY